MPVFPRLSSPVELEDEVRDLWDREQIFDKSLKQAEGKPTWVFYEGPPTANGTPHNGHVLTRVLKDVFPRYKSMSGFRVDRKAGWDTHGLPVEVEVEKSLGLAGREDIERYGLEAFNRECMRNVFTYIEDWNELTRDVGFWVDLKDPYVTFHKPYVESVWWALSRLFERGLLYQGHKVVWWWPQGGTTLSAAEVGLGYKEVDDPAVTVRFRDANNPKRSFLAWTTTPWTLPSNVALAVHRDVSYAICDDPSGEGEVVLAEALAAAHDLTPKQIVKGEHLIGARYQPVFGFGGPEDGDAYVVVHGDHVTTKSGTGIVHTAPAYGEDDMAVARSAGLGLLQRVGPDGRFVPGTGELAGLFCKDADAHIIRDLKERGLLFRRDTYRHDYPFCWRASNDPLIQFARPAWFIRTTALKDEALRNNAAVSWHPEHIKEGRFGDFLRNNVDWALSRERFWGTPLNIWTCSSCEHRVAPSSLADIEARGGEGIRMDVEEHLRVHRPWIDGVTLPCTECGGTMHRAPEVIDCWFDSGSMPFAQWGFPHQGQDAFREHFPADFICEAIDQTRGWFYTLLMISTLVFDDETCTELGLEPVGLPRPYRSCVVLGHVTDRHGYKESKSKGNYTSPNLVMRGLTRLTARPDPSVKPGTVGLLKAQIDALEIGKDPVRVSVAREPSEGDATLRGPIKPADVKGKDALNLNPSDLAALGLDPEVGGHIWFKVPFEPPGADAFRWLFCAASPPWSNTRLSFKAIREGQREFLIRLRNVYQFFSIYADIAHDAGSFDPSGAAPRPVAQRHLLDRWITARLRDTATEVTAQLDAYRLYDASRALLSFVDELSNWYVRRSRSRFWGDGADTEDALWTLYEVLCVTSRLIAPFVPHTAEALWQALVVPHQAEAPESVHLSSWPAEHERAAHSGDAELIASMALAREVAALGLAARNEAGVKVRQPLQAATVVLADPSAQGALTALAPLVTDELNVRELRFASDATDFVAFRAKPNFAVLGRKLGKRMKPLAAALAKLDGNEVKSRLDAGTLAVDVDGESIPLDSDAVILTVDKQGEYEAASSPTAVVALFTQIDEDLRAEGFVRELLNRVQTLRKEAELGYTDRVALRVAVDDAAWQQIERFSTVLCGESLCADFARVSAEPSGDWYRREWEVDGVTVAGWMRVIES